MVDTIVAVCCETCYGRGCIHCNNGVSEWEINRDGQRVGALNARHYSRSDALDMVDIIEGLPIELAVASVDYPESVWEVSP